ncbi:MAG: hypothetical protein ACI4JA_03410 [Oscillospiraceae bacterium]
MLKVIRPEDVNSVNAPVKIPDAVIVPRPVIKAPKQELGDVGIDMSSLPQEELDKLRSYFDNARKEMLEEAEAAASNAALRAEEITENARRQAEEIIREAESSAEDIISQAQAEGEIIKEQAKKDGFLQGRSEMVSVIDGRLEELSQTVNDIKSCQLENYDELCRELKYFAADIAEKLVYRKIDEDDRYLEELVKAALSEMKGGDWITVELSDKLGALARALKEAQLGGEIDENVSFEQTCCDKDTIRLSTDRQATDISIPVQLANIREFFNSGGEKNDEE